jgi:hypothetical protein
MRPEEYLIIISEHPMRSSEIILELKIIDF